MNSNNCNFKYYNTHKFLVCLYFWDNPNWVVHIIVLSSAVISVNRVEGSCIAQNIGSKGKKEPSNQFVNICFFRSLNGCKMHSHDNKACSDHFGILIMFECDQLND